MDRLCARLPLPCLAVGLQLQHGRDLELLVVVASQSLLPRNELAVGVLDLFVHERTTYRLVRFARHVPSLDGADVPGTFAEELLLSEVRAAALLVEDPGTLF